VIDPSLRMGGRVVEGSGLENRQAGNRLVGSNPTPSARARSTPNCTSGANPANNFLTSRR
jgi:hypothetical protein